MDRKQFLQYSGVVLLGLTGVQAIVPLLLQSNNPKKLAATTPVVERKRGFGNARYGK